MGILRLKMTKTIKSRKAGVVFWINNFTRDELVEICKNYGIKRGRTKSETSFNINDGASEAGHPITPLSFDVEIKIK